MNEDTSKKKEFIFPDDVESDYNIISGVSMKSLLGIILPFALLGIGIIALPPYDLIFIFIRFLIGMFVAMIGLAIVIVKPVKHCPNISLIDWLKMRQAFQKRQKRFYMRGNY